MMGPGSVGRGRASLWAALGLCIAAIFWTANGVAPWDSDTHNAWHQYEYLTEGFLGGHTYLSVEPAPELLKLKDPYDPATNAPYRVWDTSLHDGKYYLYQGPTPVVALMLPWRVVTGRMLPQRLAVAVFAAAGLAGLALLTWEIRRRYFPGLSALAMGFIVVVAFHASWLPVTLRRPALWELPVVAAAACLWWSIFFLWKYHDSGGRVRWAAAAGVALALLMGSRAAALFGAGAIALLLFARVDNPPGPGGRRWCGPLLAASLAAAGGLALLAYNRARFGHWLDFGLTYTLFGEDYRSVRYSSARFIPFNLWVYLFSPPRLGPYFPFLHSYWTDDRPAGFVGFEEVYGILFMMPVHIAAIAAFGWAWANRAAEGMRAAVVTMAASLLSSAFAALILFSWAWACSRFITELMAGWTVATVVGLMIVFTPGPNRPSRMVRAFAAAAACWTMAAVWLASAEFRGFMKQTNPATYTALAHALDYPSYWWAKSHDVGFGPVHIDITLPASGAPSRTVVMASGRPQNLNQLVLERTLGGDRLALFENEHLVLETPVLTPFRGELDALVFAPWLLPPPESPYWDANANHDLQTLFEIKSGGDEARTHSTRAADPVAFRPAVLFNADAAPGSASVRAMQRALIWPVEADVNDPQAPRGP
jgi:hypothetical protein